MIELYIEMHRLFLFLSTVIIWDIALLNSFTVCSHPPGEHPIQAKQFSLTSLLFNSLMQELTGAHCLSYSQLVNTGTHSPSSIFFLLHTIYAPPNAMNLDIWYETEHTIGPYTFLIPEVEKRRRLVPLNIGWNGLRERLGEGGEVKASDTDTLTQFTLTCIHNIHI